MKDETSTQKVKDYDATASTAINETNSDIGSSATGKTGAIRSGARTTLLAL